MSEQRRQHEGSDKDAESADRPKPSPMERFKGLTRQLLTVSRERLTVEQERYKRAAQAKKK
jgi:hypothetical protein